MRFFSVFALALIAAMLLTGCASSYAAKCGEWHPYKTWYELQWGAVERYDVYRCVYFNEVP